MRKSKTAFTLIELLVVIAIISVLAAMLLPALQRAKDMAKAAACTNQLKQLGILHDLFSSDNEDRMLPSKMYYPDNDSAYWMQLLYPYVGRKLITSNSTNGDAAAQAVGLRTFRCPAVTLNFPDSYDIYFGSELQVSYGLNGRNMNGDYIPPGDMYPNGQGSPRKNVKRPHKWVVSLDAKVWQSLYWLADDPSQPADVYYIPTERHRGRANILFLDGHVESNRRGRFQEDKGFYNWTVAGVAVFGGEPANPEPN